MPRRPKPAAAVSPALKPRGGRPGHEPTPALRRQVQQLAGLGLPQAQLATVIGIDEKTMRRHYREQLDRGKADATAKVARRLFEIATGRDPHAALRAGIFWLKAQANWSERVVVEAEHAGEVTHRHTGQAVPDHDYRGNAEMVVAVARVLEAAGVGAEPEPAEADIAAPHGKVH